MKVKVKAAVGKKVYIPGHGDIDDQKIVEVEQDRPIVKIKLASGDLVVVE